MLHKKLVLQLINLSAFFCSKRGKCQFFIILF